MATNQLKTFFNPRSIAIIGASPHLNKVGGIIIKNIATFGFKGKLYLVNPNETKVGDKVCYPSYADIPVTPDLAIVAVPALVGIDMLPSIAKKGTKNVLIFSAGFKEVGSEGVKLEQRLKEIADTYGLAILGPNCLGFLNTAVHLNATFGQATTTPGETRFISQSGAIATSLFDWANFSEVGFSEFITLGNKTVLNENDIFDYWSLTRPRSSFLRARRERAEGLSGYRPIGLYLESIDEGERFLRSVTELAKQDPVFILKPGKSKGAQAAMRSHTGALAGDDAVFEAALSKAGVIRCTGAEDLFDLTRAFAWERAPEGLRVAIVSNAGGPAVMSTDIVESEGLVLAPLSAKLQKQLAKALPPAANGHNPIDVLGDALADRYSRAMDLVLSSSEVDALMVIVTPQVMTQIELTAEVIGQMSKKYGKPIVCSFMGGSLVTPGETILNRYRIPSFRFPERALRTLGKMWWWRNWQKQQKYFSLLPKAKLSRSRQRALEDIISPVRADGRKVLTPLQTNILAEQWGMDTPATTKVDTLDGARQFVRAHHWPVVLKVVAVALLHKTEAHGVVTNISNEQELLQAYRQLMPIVKKTPQATLQIQEQILGGVEVIVGVKHDSSFGNVVLFGAGGTLAEIMEDHQLAVSPLHRGEILRLVQRSKIFKILNGFRGDKPYAVGALVKLIEQLVALTQDAKVFKEIEINPVIVTHTAAWAVDVKAIML